MNWTREGEVLEQILALLVLCAGLADRAAGRPLAVALPVLAFLARGEAVTRSYVIGLPSGAPALVAASRAEDRATRLAADFRALVRILRGLLAQARRRARFAGRRTARPAGAPQASRGVALAGHRVPALPAPDTS
jgi:hypothetical protein